MTAEDIASGSVATLPQDVERLGCPYFQRASKTNPSFFLSDCAASRPDAASDISISRRPRTRLVLGLFFSFNAARVHGLFISDAYLRRVTAMVLTTASKVPCGGTPFLQLTRG